MVNRFFKLFLIISFYSFLFGVGEKKINIPNGMVYIKGGITSIGSHYFLNESPILSVKVNSFLIDKSPVTVEEFKDFVKVTGYLTQAEEFGNAVVFDHDRDNWIIKEGAYWLYPLGKDHPKAQWNHPVTQISFRDANQYAKWKGKRLPYEVEWEHAARMANKNWRYSWKGELKTVEGIFKANTWQGKFPLTNTQEDSFLFTSPIGYFGTNSIGLTDMGGNVWEWCLDWYTASYNKLKEKKNYLGSEKKTTNKNGDKVLRGGSFMCHDSYCYGYRVSARSSTRFDNAAFHIGFRCVKDIELTK